MMPLNEGQIAEIADALASEGFIALPNAVSADELALMRARAQTLAAAGAMRQAGVGRGQHTHVAPQVRGDAIAWLDGQSVAPVDQAVLQWLASLRMALNQALYLGLTEVEAHYAIYPPGAAYVRHFDCHESSDARVISMILYLNESWSSHWGGQLQNLFAG